MMGLSAVNMRGRPGRIFKTPLITPTSHVSSPASLPMNTPVRPVHPTTTAMSSSGMTRSRICRSVILTRQSTVNCGRDWMQFVNLKTDATTSRYLIIQIAPMVAWLPTCSWKIRWTPNAITPRPVSDVNPLWKFSNTRVDQNASTGSARSMVRQMSYVMSKRCDAWVKTRLMRLAIYKTAG